MLTVHTVVRDPRHLQILSLAALLVYGFAWLEWEPDHVHATAILGTALVAQLVASRIVDVRFDPRSALISALSLCILLRTTSPWVAGLVAAVTVLSKFLIRSNGRHVFNPSNLGLVAALVLFDDAWVSGGQWGSTAFGAFLFVCVGMLIVYRAERSDVTIAFLGAYAALLLARALYLGDPLTIFVHQLESGALLLFAFLMISDPRTTPDSRAGRILFASAVAAGAYFVAFVLYEPNGLLYSLVVAAPLVRLLDHLLPGRRFEWRLAGTA